MSDCPSVRVLATGGTIANPPDSDGYLPIEELVSNVPALREVADLTVENVASTPSSGVDPATWYELHSRITSLLASDPPDGVVVTHGSNTAEETAYFLELTLDADVPVVVTAAQRNHATIGNDGDKNLLDAVLVAGCPEARGRGVLLVVNDEIHHARDVTKVVSGRPDAWVSGDFGPVGLTDKFRNVEFFRRLDGTSPTFDPGDGPADFPRVTPIYAVAGADGRLIEAAVDQGADGIVAVAFPSGVLARAGDENQRTAAERATERGVPVVVSHRGIEGWPKRTTLDERPFVSAGTLRPNKARIFLALARRRTADPERLQELFRQA